MVSLTPQTLLSFPSFPSPLSLSLSFIVIRWFACPFSLIVWRQSPTLKNAERGRSLSVPHPRLLSSFCNVCSNMVSRESSNCFLGRGCVRACVLWVWGKVQVFCLGVVQGWWVNCGV
jgi:hypothetical protein